MSIWASWLVLDGCEDEGTGPPFQYIASHVFPRQNHRHPSGYLGIAVIPGYIADEATGTAPVCEETEDLVHPWLRISCGAEDEVLNREMVVRMRDTLTEWLNRCPQR